MQEKLRQLVNIIRSDPAVDTVVGFTGGGRAGGGFLSVNLKPAPTVPTRPGGHRAAAPATGHRDRRRLFLNPVQDLALGGRQANRTYQYTLKSDNVADLRAWAMRLAEAMKQAAGADRRGHRPAGERRRGLREGGQGHRLAPGHHFARRRQRALQRLRPAPGRDHLRRAQPVPGDHGSGAALHARPEALARHLRACARRPRAPSRPPELGSNGTSDDGRHDVERAPSIPDCATRPPASPEQQRDDDGAAVGDRALRRAPHAQRGQPPGRRTRHHHLVQPRRRQDPRRGRRARRRPRPKSACRSTCAAASRARRARRRIRKGSSRC